MSYRALITIQALNEAGEVENACHATMYLGDDFSEGEAFAHKLMEKRVYPEAAHYADYSGEVSYRGYMWEKADDYRKTWADQEWVVSFQISGDYVRVVISGFDGGRNEIFKRVRVYGF